MSNELKCPFCNKPLQPTLCQSDEYWCENYDCPRTNIEWVGSQKLWQELIRTRKALDVAVEELTKIKVAAESVGIGFFMTAAICALAKIKTALEQKD